MVALFCLLLQFLASWEPAADVMALATAEFELKDIEMGETVQAKDSPLHYTIVVSTCTAC